MMDNLRSFPVGKPVGVYVTHVDEESGHLFVQINNEEAGKLDELMEQIEVFISNNSSQGLLASDVEIGGVYLAQYSVDAKWYRARVKAVKATGLCDVHFIDYGNTEQIPCKFLRHASPSFLRLHQQAFQCELDGLNKFQGPSIQKAILTMKDLTLEQELVCVALAANSGVLISKLFTDTSCSDSILDSLLSQVQRIPQQGPVTTNTASPASRKYPIISLSKGEYLDFHVSHVQDPYNFSCQLLTEINDILKLLEELAEVYSDEDVPLLSSSPGYPCCAKFYEDDCWYRAVITNSNAVASGSVDVKFVDYGNSQTTLLKDVKGLKDKYLDIPIQAIDCSLYGVRPDGNNTDWSTQAKELFSKLTSDKHIIAEVCGEDPSGKYEVRLTDMTGDMEMQLDQILVAAKYAEKTSSNVTLNTPFSQPKTKDIPQVISSQPSPKSAFTHEAITPGKEEQVLVSTIISPSEFYCMKYKTSSQLEKLMNDITRHYSGLGRDDEWLSSPSIGDPCCAKFSEDSVCYRAIVKEVQSSGKVKVQFVDYGNYDTVIPKDVKRLAPQFSELPCQAIACAMHRIGPVTDIWRHSDIKKFQELALEYTGKLTVVSENSDGLKNVELLIMQKGKEVNVAEAMLISGNASLKDGSCAQSEHLATISSKKYPKLNLPLGTYEDIFVAHAEDPANFWCQLAKHKDELDAVMNAVDEYCNSVNTPLRSPSLDLACCAQYSDGGWYRATISGVLKNNQVEVHFIDYGNYDTVSLSNLRSINPELMNLPAQAFKCRLEQMDATNASPFSSEVIDKFLDLTAEKELVGMLASYDKSNEQYLISCTDTTGGNTLDIYEQIASFLPQTSVKECFVPKQDLKPSQKEHVCVTTVQGVSEFYCQVMKHVSQFDTMMGNIDAHYNKVAPAQNEMAGLKPGDFCVAKYSEDESWYRARIVDTKINVHYIDFGNGELLSAKSIRRLVPAFTQLPIQAVVCSLAGNTAGLSDNTFKEFTLDNEFDMEVVSVDGEGKATVNLYTRDTKQPVIKLLEKEKPESPLDIQQPSLPAGTKETVYVSFAVGVSKFFVQLSKSGDSLAELMNSIHEYYSSLTESQDTLEKPQAGMVCIAKFSEDDGWYRAKVMSVQGNCAEVLYIDYGNSEVVPFAKIKKMKQEFAALSCQAVKCSLSGVAVSDENSSKFLTKVEDTEKPFVLEVVTVKADGSLEVILTDNGLPVNQELGGDQQVSDGVESDYKPFAINFKDGDFIDVNLLYCLTPHEFHCQSLTQNNIVVFNQMSSKLQGSYSSMGSSDNAITTPLKDMSCCAYYSDDNTWNRGKITQVNKDNSVQVKFVDYGNEEAVPLNQLKVLLPEFVDLPVQSIECCLSSIKPANGSQWSVEAINRFLELADQRHLVGKVINSAKQKLSLELFDTQDDSVDVNIGQVLISENHAISSTSHPKLSHLTPLVPSTGNTVYITAVESPDSIYCQLSGTEERLDTLMTNLREFYESSKVSSVQSISPNEVCVALFSEDASWYRAAVEEILSPNEVSVRFIDYGNSETLSLNNIKAIDKQFLNEQILAFECGLEGVIPVLSTGDWSQEASDFLATACGDDGFSLTVKKRDGQSIMVGLHDNNGDLAQILVKKGLAKPSQGALVGSQVSQTQASGIASYPSAPVTLGSTVDGYVTEAASPGQFYFQFADYGDSLDELMVAMGEHYSSQSAVTISSPKVGQPCIAIFEDDGLWYRAKVESLSQSQAVVRFIDYGNTQNVQLSDLKQIENQFMKVPALAAECTIDPAKFAWTSQEINHFKESIGEDKVSAEFTAKTNGRYVVRISKSGSCITDSLLKPTGSINIPHQVIKPNQKDMVYVAFAKSSSDICVQLSSFSDQLDQVMASIDNEINSQSALSENQIVPGMFCCAFFEDGWYRAIVKSKLSQGQADVEYIDYGNTARIAVSQLRSLPQSCVSLPRQAIHCTLTGPSLEGVTQETLENTLMEGPLTATFLKQNNHLWTVSLMQEGVDVTDILLINTEVVDVKEIKCSQQEIAAASSAAVFVSHMESPGEFYIQMSSSTDQLESLSSRLNDVYSQPASQCRFDVGIFCYAQFSEDSCWYRGVITSIQDDEHAKVHFVDYGNSDVVHRSKIMTLKEEFADLPILAIKCCLDKPGTEWSDGQFAKFEELVIDQELSVNFTEKHDEFWKVTLSSGNTPILESIREETKIVKKAEEKVAETGTDVNLLETTVDLNTTCQAYISHMESPGEFYIQMSSSTEQLESLSSRLNDVYSQPASQCRFDVGSFCCAQFSEDSCWYRGVITSIQDDEHAKVHFVDYGNSDVVHRSKIMTLKEEFADLPILAIKCCLDKPGTKWSGQQIAKFEELVLDQELTVNFAKRHDPFWQVNLSCGGTSILESVTGITILGNEETTTAEKVNEMERDANLVEATVDLNFTCQVYVSHIENLGEFFVQMSSSTDKLQTLSSRLNDAYSQPASHCRFDVGSFCCAQFSEDSCWYRGVITSIQDDDHANVHFVDYGNSDVVHRSKIMTLKEEFADLPILAIKCCLDKPGTEWSDGQFAKFEELVVDQELTAYFQEKHDLLWQVKLWCGDTSVVESVQGKMHSVNEENTKAQDVAEVKKEVILNEAAIDLCSTCIAYTSHIENPGEFYVQLGSSTDQLHTLSTKLNDTYSQPATHCHFDVGSFCCAQFSEDSCWYRGVITSIQDDEHAKVHFVDYGNSDVVHRSKIMTLKEEFADLPILAIKCCLDKPGTEWSEVEFNRFEALVLDQELTAEFLVKHDTLWQVKLSFGGASILDLVRAGEVKEAKVPESQPCDEISNRAVKSLSIATLSEKSREGVKLLSVDEESMVYLQPIATENELTDLMVNIAENPPKQPLPSSNIIPGNLCLSKFTEDDEWYRAKVIECNQDQVTVNYVDFGNTEIVEVIRLGPMNDSYLELPAQAIKCSLYGINTLDEDVRNKLNEEYVEAKLEAEVIEKTADGIDSVKLFQENEELILMLIQGKSQTDGKEPIPAVSKKNMDEPDSQHEQSSENVSQTEVENQEKSTIGTADETADPSHDLVPTNECKGDASNGLKVQSLDQEEIERKIQVKIELSEEELSYSECDTNNSIDESQQSKDPPSQIDNNAKLGESLQLSIKNDSNEIIETKTVNEVQANGFSDEAECANNMDEIIEREAAELCSTIISEILLSFNLKDDLQKDQNQENMPIVNGTPIIEVAMQNDAGITQHMEDRTNHPQEDGKASREGTEVLENIEKAIESHALMDAPEVDEQIQGKFEERFDKKVEREGIQNVYETDEEKNQIEVNREISTDKDKNREDDDQAQKDNFNKDNKSEGHQVEGKERNVGEHKDDEKLNMNEPEEICKTVEEGIQNQDENDQKCEKEGIKIIDEIEKPYKEDTQNLLASHKPQDIKMEKDIVKLSNSDCEIVKRENIQVSNGHEQDGNSNGNAIDDGCLSDSALEKLDSLLESAPEELTDEQEKDKKSCKHM